MPKDDGLRPPPEVEPRPAVDGADLREFGSRTLLGAFPRRNARVHENVAMFSDEEGTGSQPAEPILEG